MSGSKKIIDYSLDAALGGLFVTTCVISGAALGASLESRPIGKLLNRGIDHFLGNHRDKNPGYLIEQGAIVCGILGLLLYMKLLSETGPSHKLNIPIAAFNTARAIYKIVHQHNSETLNGRRPARTKHNIHPSQEAYWTDRVDSEQGSDPTQRLL